MLRIPRVAADLPQVGLHGLLAVRLVLLREEGCLVGRDVHQVLRASENSRCHCLEARTDLQFTSRQRRATLVAVGVKRVHALTIGVFGGRLAKDSMNRRVGVHTSDIADHLVQYG